MYKSIKHLLSREYVVVMTSYYHSIHCLVKEAIQNAGHIPAKLIRGCSAITMLVLTVLAASLACSMEQLRRIV